MTHIAASVREQRSAELAADIRARTRTYDDAHRLEQAQRDPLLAPLWQWLVGDPASDLEAYRWQLILGREDIAPVSDPAAMARHALVDVLPFTQPDGGAYGAEPPAFEPSPIWPRRWASNESVGTEYPWLGQAARLFGTSFPNPRTRPPSEVTAELDAAAQTLGVWRNDGQRGLDPELADPHQATRTPAQNAEARARYRRLHDQATHRVQGEATERSAAIDAPRRDTIASIFAALEHGDLAPLTRVGLIAIAQQLLALAQRGIRPIVESPAAALALVRGFQGTLVKAPPVSELPSWRGRLATKPGSVSQGRAGVPRSRGGYAFPLWPNYVDFETDQNTALALLADDGLVVIEMSDVERENVDLKARLAKYEALEPTPEPSEPPAPPSPDDTTADTDTGRPVRTRRPSKASP